MTTKLTFTLLALLTILVTPSLAQTTTVDVHLSSGTIQSYEIANNGKLYFENNYLLIEDGLNAPYSIPVSDIQKLLFSYNVGIQDIETPECKIYPNPASSYLKISSTENNQNQYQLFSYDGKMLLDGSCGNDESIDIQALPKGLYLIKVNGRTFKITKL
ncbi:MAG: T9SS type A sorting domain-containing protein [Bacteroidales bacterium]|nr:T9SS type A sorting domain-containing protein [Bacteroidales bacterium]